MALSTKTKPTKGEVMWKASLLGLTMITLAPVTWALPILSESTDGKGLVAVIHPDHEVSNKVYFFPNTGALEKTDRGVPRFGMSYWGIKTNDPDAGGYFSGIFRLGMSADLRESVQRLKGSGYQVAVMPVQESKIYFMQDENGERRMPALFKEVDVPPYGGQPDASIGLSAYLSKLGARMLAKQLTSGALGLDLNYCYKVKGVSPVFHAKIVLNYHKIYEHFIAQAHGTFFWHKWQIRSELEKLIENKDISIEINGGDANKYDYIMALADRMVARFFDPQLENRRAPEYGNFSVGYNRVVEDRVSTFDLKQREIIEREFCVALGLDELKEFPWLVVNADEI